jgi:hypothetical protein
VQKRQPETLIAIYSSPTPPANHGGACVHSAAYAARTRAASGHWANLLHQSAPAAGDTQLLQTIFHDWEDARAKVIFRDCQKAVTSTGRIRIIEREAPKVAQSYE